MNIEQSNVVWRWRRLAIVMPHLHSMHKWRLWANFILRLLHTFYLFNEMGPQTMCVIKCQVVLLWQMRSVCVSLLFNLIYATVEYTMSHVALTHKHTYTVQRRADRRPTESCLLFCKRFALLYRSQYEFRAYCHFERNHKIHYKLKS